MTSEDNNPMVSTSAHMVKTTNKVSAAVDLAAANNAYMSNFENIIAPGKEVCMTKEYKPKVAYKFGRHLNPDELKRHVLQSEKLRALIENYARTTQKSVKQIEKQARIILDEIGLDRNLPIIRWCGMAITAIGKRICDGIYVNAASMAIVKQDLGHSPVLYLPSHRSYMDFILMSYICFYYDIEIPGIAAGMDFHSMFGMGTMLRKTGAFFMRRTFSDDNLYWDIFREYMYALVAKYHIGVEFFIEGTRSRNFKALVPKIGLLSMALLPYFTGEVPDITIVPVSISYERILEEKLFVYELLGVPKPRETTKGFFRALKIIDERFGKMYLDFGTPISMRQFLEHSNTQRLQHAAVGPHLQKLNRREIELIKVLANEIIYQQQRRIVVSTFNLLCLYYASQLYAQRTVHIDELARGILYLKNIFEKLGAHVSTNPSNIKAEIIETVAIHSNILQFRKTQLEFTQLVAADLAQQIDVKRLKAHALTPQTMAVAVPMLALQLYINPCTFWLARLAYLVLAALKVQHEQREQLPQVESAGYDAVLEQLRAHVSSLDAIFQHEFILESNREVEEFKSNLQLLQNESILEFCACSGKLTVNDNSASRAILSALAPFLCLYYQLTVTLRRQLPLQCEFSNKDVLVLVQQRIEQLLQQPHAVHVHPYCLALDNLNIALYSFVQSGLLHRQRDTGLMRHIENTDAFATLESLLLSYCQLMPFEQYSASAKQQVLINHSKL